MADLAKTLQSFDTRRRGSANRDYTIPARRNTDAPSLEINAPIIRPSGPAESAEILARTLGLATDTVTAFGENAMERTAGKRAGQGALDGSRGTPDEALFAKSRAYREAFQLEGAKSGAFKVDLDVTKLVEDRLNDPDDPATLDDIQDIIDSAFSAFATDDDGKARDFGNPKASLAVAQQLNATRTRIMGAAYEAIRARTDADAIQRVGLNVINELIQGDIPTVPGAPPTIVQEGASARTSTGRLPVQGRVSSAFGQRAAPTAGASTNHNGIDIVAPTGTPVEAPAGGRVLQVGSNKKAGNFVIIDHGDGIQTSYSHLSTVDVKKGDTITAGTTFAKVGRSGNATGSNLHYVVRVNGKAVDPQAFSFSGSSTPAAGPLQPATDVGESRALPPPLPFEAALDRIPPTVNRGEAKKAVLSMIVQAADEKDRPEWLDALWRSTRKDGSPSFSPDEIRLIRDERDRIREKMRVEAKRAQVERYDANEEVLMSAIAQDRPPSRETIRQWESEDRISGRFAAALIDSMDAEDRQAAREARAEAREAERQADADLDFEASVEADLRRSGAINGVSHDTDVARFQRGELGTGRRAVARFKMLRNAAKQGEAALFEQPQVAHYANHIRRFWKPGRSTSAVANAMGAGAKSVDPAPAILAEYKRQIKKGEEPYQAYVAAVAAQGPKDNKNVQEARRQRLAELDARAREGR